MSYIKSFLRLKIVFAFIVIGSLGSVFVVWAACTEICLDFDGDGWGSPASGLCGQAELDCNDSDPSVHAGTPESSFFGNCSNGLDDDCDGSVDCNDSGCASFISCLAAIPMCTDGFCDAGETCVSCWADCGTAGNSVCDETCGECPGGIHENITECGCGNGTMECGEECDDGNLTPGDGCSALCQIEVAGACVDSDGDGYDAIDPINCPSGTDCNDGSFDMKPGVLERCDSLDWNCDGDDIDGLGAESCQLSCLALDPSNYWSGNGGSLNCCGNDLNEGPYVANEVGLCSDGRDNDCDGTTDLVPGFEDDDCQPCLPTTFDSESLWFIGGEPDCDQCNHDGDDSGNQSNVAGEWLTNFPLTPEMADQCDSNCNPTLSATVHINNYQPTETNCSDGIDNDCDGTIDSGPGCTNFCVFPITLPCTILP